MRAYKFFFNWGCQIIDKITVTAGTAVYWRWHPIFYFYLIVDKCCGEKYNSYIFLNI